MQGSPPYLGSKRKASSEAAKPSTSAALSHQKLPIDGLVRHPDRLKAIDRAVKDSFPHLDCKWSSPTMAIDLRAYALLQTVSYIRFAHQHINLVVQTYHSDAP